MLGAAAVVAAGWAPPGVGGETAGRAADGRAEGVIDRGAGPCCAASGVPVRAAKPKPQAAAMVARLISISLPAPFLLEESRAGRLQSNSSRPIFVSRDAFRFRARARNGSRLLRNQRDGETTAPRWRPR